MMVLLLAPAQPFEDLLFNALGACDSGEGGECEGATREELTLTFTATRAGMLEGYYAYMRVEAAEGAHSASSATSA